jgi:hypothetical protein
VTATATSPSGDTSEFSATKTVAPAPQNDYFSSAKQIKGSRVSVNGTTRDATREPGEPDHNVDPADPFSATWIGDHSVWYRWKALASGQTTINTCQASIDSILAVYTGTSPGTLTRVVDNNNHPDCPSGTFGSKVVFNAKRGTVYRIAVGDAGGARENAFTIKVAGKRR